LGEDKYKFFEKLNVLMIPLPVTYLVKVVANVDQQSIIMQADVMNMVNISIHFQLKKDGEVCIVNESVEFKTKLPLRPMMEKIFKAHHLKLFANMEKA